MSISLSNIKALIFDVDGVLTDGGIYYDANGMELKKFNVKDGIICEHLKTHNYLLGIISGRESPIIEKRFSELNFDFISQGCKNKEVALKEFAKIFNLDYSQIIYTGDDINDLPIFSLVGLSCCPNDAREYIKKNVDYVTPSNGGCGVLRDVADMLLESNK